MDAPISAQPPSSQQIDLVIWPDFTFPGFFRKEYVDIVIYLSFANALSMDDDIIIDIIVIIFLTILITIKRNIQKSSERINRRLVVLEIGSLVTQYLWTHLCVKTVSIPNSQWARLVSMWHRLIILFCNHHHYHHQQHQYCVYFSVEGVSGDVARVETFIVKMCHKKRKESSAPMMQVVLSKMRQSHNPRHLSGLVCVQYSCVQAGVTPSVLVLNIMLISQNQM